MTVANTKILQFYYTKVSALETALSTTFREGDLITDADISGATALAWQQMAIDNPISDLKFMTEALESEQFGEYSRDNVTIKGFEKPEGVIKRIHDATMSTTHLDILKGALGAVVTGSGNTDTVATSAQATATVTITGTSIVVGDEGKFITIGNNKTVLLNVTGSVITLASKINVKAGDVITVPVQNGFDLDNVDDTPFIVFIKTEKENYLVSWVRFGLDFSTPPNSLKEMMFNFQGDKALISTLTPATIGTVVSEAKSLSMTTNNFKGISIANSDAFCADSFDFKLTREMVRKACQGTESQNGNGGTYKDNYTTELTVIAYASSLNSVYEENTYISVLAQKSSFAIYAAGALVKSQDTNSTNANMHTTTYIINANVDMSKKLMISL